MVCLPLPLYLLNFLVVMCTNSMTRWFIAQGMSNLQLTIVHDLNLQEIGFVDTKTWACHKFFKSPILATLEKPTGHGDICSFLVGRFWNNCDESSIRKFSCVRGVILTPSAEVPSCSHLRLVFFLIPFHIKTICALFWINYWNFRIHASLTGEQFTSWLLIICVKTSQRKSIL